MLIVFPFCVLMHMQSALTPSIWSTSAPRSSSSRTVSVWPQRAARINAVSPSCRTIRGVQYVRICTSSAPQSSAHSARRRRGTYQVVPVLIWMHALVQQPPHLVHLATVGRLVQLRPRHHWRCAPLCCCEDHIHERDSRDRRSWRRRGGCCWYHHCC